MVYPVPSGGAQRIWKRGFENIFYFQARVAEDIGTAAVNAAIIGGGARWPGPWSAPS